MARIMNPNNVLHYLRMWYGLTQTELAQKVNLFQCDIASMEQKKFGLFSKYLDVAKYFDVPVDAIYHDDFRAVIPKLKQPPVSWQIRNRRFGKKDLIGPAGEELVAELERQRLRGTVFADGVNPNYAKDTKAGFDIFSFDRDGRLKFIEVKTTSNNVPDEFMISDLEHEFMICCDENGWDYEIHRVWNLRDDAVPQRTVYPLETLKRAKIKVATYQMSMRDAV